MLRLGLPLMRVDPAVAAAAQRRGAARLADLPRPLTAVLVGGPTEAVAFDAAVARELAARGGGREIGGSLFVRTSRRTPPEVVDALAASAAPRRSRLYRWQPDATRRIPYLALLGLADRFVVTTDSVTMMVEVARLGRPLAIFELPLVRGGWRRGRSSSRSPAVPSVALTQGARGATRDPSRRRAGGTPPDELPRVVARIRAVSREELLPPASGRPGAAAV